MCSLSHNEFLEPEIPMEVFHESGIRLYRYLRQNIAVFLQEIRRAPGLELRGPCHPKFGQFVDLAVD